MQKNSDDFILEECSDSDSYDTYGDDIKKKIFYDQTYELWPN